MQTRRDLLAKAGALGLVTTSAGCLSLVSDGSTTTRSCRSRSQRAGRGASDFVVWNHTKKAKTVTVSITRESDGEVRVDETIDADAAGREIINNMIINGNDFSIEVNDHSDGAEMANWENAYGTLHAILPADGNIAFANSPATRGPCLPEQRSTRGTPGLRVWNHTKNKTTVTVKAIRSKNDDVEINRTIDLDALGSQSIDDQLQQRTNYKIEVDPENCHPETGKWDDANGLLHVILPESNNVHFAEAIE